MAKVRMTVAVRRVTVADSGPGPIRAVIEAADRNGLALYAPKLRKQFLQTALETAGEEWIEKYLPLRFEPYARTIGYRAKFGKQPGKPTQIQPTGGLGRVTLRRDAPLVRTGALAAAAIAGARVRGLTGAKPRVVIKFPQVHRLRPQEQVVLRTIPEKEVRAIAAMLDRALAQAFAGAGAVQLPQPAGRP